MTKCNNPQSPNQDDCPCGENCPCTKEHNCAQHSPQSQEIEHLENEKNAQKDTE